MTTTVHPEPPPPTDPDPTPGVVRRAAPTRRTEVAVGLLFLLATATFAAGDSLLDRAPVTAVLLQAVTGLAVVGTGWLLLPVLTPYAPRRARGYLLARLLECAAIVTCGTFLLVTGSSVPSYTLLVYAFTGAAGLLLTHALLDSGLVPRWLAGLGMLGYAALLLGTGLDVAGLLDLTTAAGAVLLAPGGLFEVVFPVLLLARGFRR